MSLVFRPKDFQGQDSQRAMKRAVIKFWSVFFSLVYLAAVLTWFQRQSNRNTLLSLAAARARKHL
jgi:hypothetical protein